MSTIPETIRELIAAKCAELGFELFDVRYFQAGSRAVMRVTIDSQNGVSIGDCERASQELSVMLDVEDFSAGRPYILEVSSPGIDRPLRTERDFRRSIGRFVMLNMTPQYEGKKTLRVKVTGCSGGIVQGELDGSAVELPLSAISSGKEELQFK
jgi:ribosome maturation factor RimP